MPEILAALLGAMGGASGGSAGLGLAQPGMGAMPAGGMGPMSGGTSGVLGGFPQMAQANQGLPAPVTSMPSQAPGGGFMQGVAQGAGQGTKAIAQGQQERGPAYSAGTQPVPLDPMLLKLLGL